MPKNGSKTHQKTPPKSKASKGKKPTCPSSSLLSKMPQDIRLWILGGSLFLFLFLYIFHPIIMPFFVALIFAYALDPAVSFFESKGLGRKGATLIIVLSVVMLISTVLFFSIPFLIDALQTLGTSLPGYLETIVNTFIPTLESWLSIFKVNIEDEIEKTLMENISQMLQWVFSVLSNLFTNTLALTNLVSLVFLVPILIFYLLHDWPRIVSYGRRLIPPTMQGSSQKLGKDINEVLKRYFRGQASICLILAGYYIVSLFTLKLEYAFTIGLISGLLVFIPYIGFFTGFVAAIGVGLAQFGLQNDVFIIVLVYAFGQILDSFILAPNFLGKHMGLHPVWAAFSLIAGGFIMGFIGLIFVVPIAAVLAILLRFVINKYQQRLKEHKIP